MMGVGCATLRGIGVTTSTSVEDEIACHGNGGRNQSYSGQCEALEGDAQQQCKDKR
jgi:hypothetical protein